MMRILSKFKRKRSKLTKYRSNYKSYRPINTRRRALKIPLKNRLPWITKLSRIALFVLVIATITITAYSIFFADYFKIKNVVVTNEGFENETLTKKINTGLKSSLQKSIFLTDLDELELKILESFPELEKIDIEKNYPASLNITFAEHPLVANIINESNSLRKTYVINSLGYAMKENFENPNLPYIRIKSDEPINTNSAVIESQKLDYILETIAYFQDKFGMKIKEVSYLKIARELHLLTERNFEIWLDIEVSSQEQLKKLKKALVKIDIYKENFEYIDLRIAGGSGDKIIYKRSP